MTDSRLAGFYRSSISERVETLLQRGLISPEDAQKLLRGSGFLDAAAADKMIENVIGVFGLPLGIAANFRINQRDFVVPMVVEEPSIVAGVSAAAKVARSGGGFLADIGESLLIGQVQIVDIADPAKAIAQLIAAREDLIVQANATQPNMLARGGGAQSIEIHEHTLLSGEPMLVLHLLVDTRDAMGANLVNTMCEGIASTVEMISGGKVFLRILSNLTDRSIVTARVRMPLAELAAEGFGAEVVRDGIILANDFALVDPYRAATHNKGIMNGIDAVAIATGNDWRAIEASTHAYAARAGRYQALTRWFKMANGDLGGELKIPMKVGTVGGSLQSNPAVLLNLNILGVKSARELSEVIACVGLAQNFAALRALVTHGIQRGHMRLHARSVAATAGTPDYLFEEVVNDLIRGGDIKVEKAAELLKKIDKPEVLNDDSFHGVAASKVILLGEHAAVYNKHVLAVPINNAVTVRIQELREGVRFAAPDWGVAQHFLSVDQAPPGVATTIAFIMRRLQIENRGFDIELRSRIPKAMGLGASAAMVVAIIRAFSHLLQLDMTDREVNSLAFACEQLAHGTPSGVDNTVATYAQPLLYCKGEPPLVHEVAISEPIPLVIAASGVPGYTLEQVAAVRRRFEKNETLYSTIFNEIGEMSAAGAIALSKRDYAQLGAFMNVCHGMLNAIEVSTPLLETMVQIARDAGAIGAKLTGAGGGGSIVALCPGKTREVAAALKSAGFQTIPLNLNQDE